MHLKTQALREVEEQRKEFDQRYLAHVVGLLRVTILKQSGFFEGHGDFLGLKPHNHSGDLYALLNQEGQQELELRERYVGQYITQEGLDNYRKEIVASMNQSCGRVLLFDPDFIGNVLEHILICRHDSSALLSFAFDYVDRWKMYHKLFSQV